jgi:hypothetical protein
MRDYNDATTQKTRHLHTRRRETLKSHWHMMTVVVMVMV